MKNRIRKNKVKVTIEKAHNATYDFCHSFSQNARKDEKYIWFQCISEYYL